MQDAIYDKVKRLPPHIKKPTKRTLPAFCTKIGGVFMF